MVVDSSEVHLLKKKPDKRIFMILLDRLVLKPEDVCILTIQKIYIRKRRKWFCGTHFKFLREASK